MYENDSLTGSNVSEEIIEENEFLTPGDTEYITDTTFQVGGPIKRDKLWFFTSFQYYRPKTSAAELSADATGRLFRHRYRATGTAGEIAALPVQADGEDRPERHSSPASSRPTAIPSTVAAPGYDTAMSIAGSDAAPGFTRVRWNGNFTKVLSSSSVFDVKYSGFWGYYYLSPYNGDDAWLVRRRRAFYAVNSYYFYNADRVRHQANATLTKFASGFAGEHNLKFGAEFERSYVKSEHGYPGGMYIFADFGVPYYAYLWDGYLKDNINNSSRVFAQDSWTIGQRLTINPGLRFDRITGFNKHLDETGVHDQFVCARASASPGMSRATARRSSAATTAGTSTARNRRYYDLLDPQISPFYGAYIDAEPEHHGGTVSQTTGYEPIDG